VSYVVAATTYVGSSLYLDPFIEASSIGESERARRLLLRYASELQTSLTALRELPGLVDRDDRLFMSLLAAGADWEIASDLVRELVPGVPLETGLCTMVWRLLEHRGPGRQGRRLLSERATRYVSSPASAAVNECSVAAPPDDVYTELVTHRLLGSLFRFVLCGSEPVRGSMQEIPSEHI